MAHMRQRRRRRVGRLGNPDITCGDARGVLRAAVAHAAGAALGRALSDMAISDQPPKSILMPMRRPKAHNAVPGNPANNIAANTISSAPLASIQPQEPDSLLRCWIANMIDTAPSMKRNAIRTTVKEIARDGGCKEEGAGHYAQYRRDHRPREARCVTCAKVMMRPTMPAISKIEPKNTVAASEATRGTKIANTPKKTSTSPSTRNKTQWSRTDLASAARACPALTESVAFMIYLLVWHEFSYGLPQLYGNPMDLGGMSNCSILVVDLEATCANDGSIPPGCHGNH
jgi:hypothetical protein